MTTPEAFSLFNVESTLTNWNHPFHWLLFALWLSILFRLRTRRECTLLLKVLWLVSMTTTGHLLEYFNNIFSVRPW